MKYTYQKSFEKGYNSMVSALEHPEMMGMEFGVVTLAEGDVLQFAYPQETVYTLLCGAVEFIFAGNTAVASRRDVFHDGASLLHVPHDMAVTIRATAGPVEIAISRVANSKTFAARFYAPDDCINPTEIRGAGLMNDCSTRLVRTFFDRTDCPETNFYIGEVVHHPGKWSSYPPHSHIEPELYFYKFLPENGYGLAEYGDQAFKVKHNDLTGMPEHVTHAQVAAPGYAEYYLWCIRLQEDVALDTVFVPEHKWVTDSAAKFFPDI